MLPDFLVVLRKLQQNAEIVARVDGDAIRRGAVDYPQATLFKIGARTRDVLHTEHRRADALSGTQHLVQQCAIARRAEQLPGRACNVEANGPRAQRGMLGCVYRLCGEETLQEPGG